MENLLKFETSPYLLQHKDDPVHWRAWNEETLNLASQGSKPILLSVGYAACHWCHVMAHESFSDPEIANAMNEHYISVKVDREERPDVDYIYQQALAALGEHGGWPLTMFLTPDGSPFWGGTYFPPQTSRNRQGFLEVLRTVAKIYQKSPEKIQSNVSGIRQALTALTANQAGQSLTLEFIDRNAQEMVRGIDPFNGGFGRAPKFPHPTGLELLWRAWLRSGQTPYKTAVETTLLHICQGGIYDHLKGGFYRYAVDAAWLIPHFEKMLYDNALLIKLLTLVWQKTKNPLFKQRVFETIDWAVSEMMNGILNQNEKAFASSLDADSEGIEGQFYVWTEEEIDRVLGERSYEFKQAYGVSAEGNWEGKNILNRLHALEAEETDLSELKERVLKAREERVRPERDDKIVSDVNGLMITALTEASMVFDVPQWLEIAQKAYDFILIHMVTRGRLSHSWRLEKAQHPAILEDYANLCHAGLTLYEATGSFYYVRQVRERLRTLDLHYWDESGGYCLTANDTSGLIIRVKTAKESSVPNGNGTMIGVLARLCLLTQDSHSLNRLKDLMKALGGEVEGSIFECSTFLNNTEFWLSTVHIMIVGPSDTPMVQEFKRVVFESCLPNRLLSVHDPREVVEDLSPYLKNIIENASRDIVTAYVCVNETCSLPLISPQALADHLNTL